MIHNGMPCDPIKGQDHGGQKVVKIADFKASPGTLVIRRLMVILQNNIRILTGRIFDIQHHVTFKLRVFHLWQTNFASYEELTVSPLRHLFIIC